MARVVQIARWLPFLALSLLALAHEPSQSGFSATFPECELVPTGPQLAAAFTNQRHLVSFFVLFLMAAIAFRTPTLSKAAIAVFALSLLIEFEQALFTEGHCRAWDLFPNIMAIAGGWALASLAVLAWRRFRA